MTVEQGTNYLVGTEPAAILAASAINSPRDIEASVYVVRAFVKMRDGF